MQKAIISISTIALISIGCRWLTIFQPTPIPITVPTWTISPLPTPTEPFDQAQAEPATPQPTFIPTETFTPHPSETPFPTFTDTPTFTPVPQWIVQGPDEVIVPILLYHHIGYSPSNSRYYVSAFEFDQQMYVLHKWEYQTISVELMIKAIAEGAELPPKPIILTFDDGSETISTTALPIMQRYGFTGSAYIVHNYIAATHYMDVEQIRGLYDAGWEIGSHSISHVDLTERTDRQRDEIVDSRIKLQRTLGIPILTFAYPYGAYNEDSVHFARFAGYIGAVGLGDDPRQGWKNLYYLYRMDVNGFDDLTMFASLLPWREDMDNISGVTNIP